MQISDCLYEGRALEEDNGTISAYHVQYRRQSLYLRTLRVVIDTLNACQRRGTKHRRVILWSRDTIFKPIVEQALV